MTDKFHVLQKEINVHVDKMMSKNDKLYTVNIDREVLWQTYLSSFNPEDNKLFRQRTEHDCATCRHFIKGLGNVVAINDDYSVTTVWDIDMHGTIYEPVVKAMSELVRGCLVDGMFLTTFKKFGNEFNFEDGEKTIKWNHLWANVNRNFMFTDGTAMNRELSNFNGKVKALKNGMNNISVGAVDIVIDILDALYKGEEYRYTLTEYRKLRLKCDNLMRTVTESAEELQLLRNRFFYLEASRTIDSVAKIRNTSIGTLLEDISSGLDLEDAVKRYESKVAPENYKRTKTIATKKMIDDAFNTVKEKGYADSLPRRFANLDDITLPNVLFANRDVKAKLTSDGVEAIFDDLKKTAKVSSKIGKKPSGKPISYEDFIKNVLPVAQELELYLEGKHEKNLVSLTAPVNKDSKSLFKWGNTIGWAYNGNMTDSALKNNVKNAGGNVEGDLRFSIQWNDICRDNSDLDAHCITPNGFEIYYHQKKDPYTKGELDVDIIRPFERGESTPAVENITWQRRDTMTDGDYLFCVHNFTDRGNTEGFRAEIEFDNTIYKYDFRGSIKNKGVVKVAIVTLKNGEFTIKHLLTEQEQSRDIWGLKTNEYQPVQLVCYSPNYFDEQIGIGHKHLMFMLKDCVNDSQPNGFYNEYLKDELYEHRRVFEILGSKFKVEATENQLSGVGFSTTQRNNVTVRVNNKDIYEVTF